MLSASITKQKGKAKGEKPKAAEAGPNCKPADTTSAVIAAEVRCERQGRSTRIRSLRRWRVTKEKKPRRRFLRIRGGGGDMMSEQGNACKNDKATG